VQIGDDTTDPSILKRTVLLAECKRRFAALKLHKQAIYSAMWKCSEGLSRNVKSYSESMKVSSQSLPAVLIGARIVEWSQSGSSERSGLLRIRTSNLNAKVDDLQLQDEEIADRNFFWLVCTSWQ